MNRPRFTGMLGRLLDVAATLSLLAAVAAGSLWWRGYDEPDHFWVCYRSGVIDSVKSDRGEVTFARRRTPFPVRSASFFRESGRRVRPRLAASSCAVQRRWGPFVFAATPPAPPPSAAQLREADLLVLEARAFDMAPAPTDEQEREDWSGRRAQAYRAAREAHRQLNASRSSLRLVVLPCWALVLPLLVLPAVKGWGLYRAGARAEEAAAAAAANQGAAKPLAVGAATQAMGASPDNPSAPHPTEGVATEALPYTDRRHLAARVAAYRGDRMRQHGPPRRPRPHR